MALTPFPKERIAEKDGSLNFKWSQWFTAFRNAFNFTPGNSLPVAFADLPVPVTGMILVVTDSTVNTWGSVVTGGGAFTVAAFWNGTQWTVAAK